MTKVQAAIQNHLAYKEGKFQLTREKTIIQGQRKEDKMLDFSDKDFKSCIMKIL